MSVLEGIMTILLNTLAVMSIQSVRTTGAAGDNYISIESVWWGPKSYSPLHIYMSSAGQLCIKL